MSRGVLKISFQVVGSRGRQVDSLFGTCLPNVLLANTVAFNVSSHGAHARPANHASREILSTIWESEEEGEQDGPKVDKLHRKLSELKALAGQYGIQVDFNCDQHSIELMSDVGTIIPQHTEIWDEQNLDTDRLHRLVDSIRTEFSDFCLGEFAKEFDLKFARFSNIGLNHLLNILGGRPELDLNYRLHVASLVRVANSASDYALADWREPGSIGILKWYHMLKFWYEGFYRESILKLYDVKEDKVNLSADQFSEIYNNMVQKPCESLNEPEMNGILEKTIAVARSVRLTPEMAPGSGGFAILGQAASESHVCKNLKFAFPNGPSSVPNALVEKLMDCIKAEVEELNRIKEGKKFRKAKGFTCFGFCSGRSVQ